MKNNQKRTKQEWQTLYRQWVSSGQSRAKFARENGLRLPAFYAICSKLSRQEKGKKEEFIELPPISQITDKPAIAVFNKSNDQSEKHPKVAEINLGGAITIRIEW